MIYEVMYSIRDGEIEYGDRFFVVAKNPDEAWTHAYRCLLEDYWDGEEPRELPTPGQMRNGVDVPGPYDRTLSLTGIYPKEYIQTVDGHRIQLTLVKEVDNVHQTENKQLGKFEGNKSQWKAHILYALIGVSGQIDEFGSVDDIGWYGLIVGRRYAWIVCESNLGFFSVLEEGSPKDVTAEFNDKQQIWFSQEDAINQDDDCPDFMPWWTIWKKDV